MSRFGIWFIFIFFAFRGVIFAKSDRSICYDLLEQIEETNSKIKILEPAHFDEGVKFWIRGTRYFLGKNLNADPQTVVLGLDVSKEIRPTMRRMLGVAKERLQLLKYVLEKPGHLKYALENSGRLRLDSDPSKNSLYINRLQTDLKAATKAKNQLEAYLKNGITYGEWLVLADALVDFFDSGIYKFGETKQTGVISFDGEGRPGFSGEQALRRFRVKRLRQQTFFIRVPFHLTWIVLQDDVQYSNFNSSAVFPLLLLGVPFSATFADNILRKPRSFVSHDTAFNEGRAQTLDRVRAFGVDEVSFEKIRYFLENVLELAQFEQRRLSVVLTQTPKIAEAMQAGHFYLWHETFTNLDREDLFRSTKPRERNNFIDNFVRRSKDGDLGERSESAIRIAFRKLHTITHQ